MFRKDIPGWLNGSEVEAIERLCGMVAPYTNIIEIGPFAGRTTQVIASLCKTNTIHSIDPWPIQHPPRVWDGMLDYVGPPFDTNDVQGIFRREIMGKHSNVIGIHGEYPGACPKIDNVGWIHWDTDTIFNINDVLSQLNFAWTQLKPGGILSGHTFAWWMPNVVQAVRQFADEKKLDIVLPYGGSIWYTKK